MKQLVTAVMFGALFLSASCDRQPDPSTEAANKAIAAFNEATEFIAKIKNEDMAQKNKDMAHLLGTRAQSRETLFIALWAQQKLDVPQELKDRVHEARVRYGQENARYQKLLKTEAVEK